MKQCY